MTKEELIAKILEFPAALLGNCYIYDVITDGEWDMKKLEKQYNLILHLIWRELRNEKHSRNREEMEKNETSNVEVISDDPATDNVVSIPTKRKRRNKSL